MDITQLILDDHHEQRRLFSILEQIDDADVAALTAVWGRLSSLLDVHAEAEELFFYPDLLRVGVGEGGRSDAADETRDAVKDHNEIRDAVADAQKETVGTPAWRKAVAAANEANGDHMAEEEREGLTDFRLHADLALRHALAVKFVGYELAHLNGIDAVDKDPKAYVKANQPAER